MGKPHRFRELKIWQRAMAFIIEVYRLSARFPKHEQFGLTSQIRRAATSIALNIAEGAGSGSDVEFCRFLRYSLRSIYEVMTALEIAQGLGYCAAADTQPLLDEADEIAAMTYGFAKTLSSPKPPAI
jgi:four helix bundle protein